MPVDDGYVPAESVTIRDQLAVVGRRWRIVAVFVVVGALVGGLYIHTKKSSYVSHADVRLSAPLQTPFSSTTPVASTLSMPTELKTAQSLTIAAAAAATLGHGATGTSVRSHTSVTVPATTNILDIAYSAGSPKAAQAGAAAYLDAYLAARKTTNQQAVAKQQANLNDALSSLLARRHDLNVQLDHTPATDQAQIYGLNQQLGQVQTPITADQQALTALGSIDPQAAKVSQAASLPVAPAGASHKIILVGGLVGGLVLGLIAAFVLDATDDHLLGPNDLVALLGVPVLTRVPAVRSLPWQKPDLAADGTSHPKVAEAYRLLANRLVVAASKDSISSLLIASPAQGEGRSSVAANLSATFVELGFRVWLVSADLMPPQVHRLFSPDVANDRISVVPIEVNTPVPSNPTSELTFEVESDTEPTGHLTLMSSIERARPAGRLLNPFVLARQVRHNQEHVDITIVDAPALLDFADAVPLLPVVDGVIVVADAAATQRGEIIELAELLHGSGARIVGSVLNRDGSRVVSRRARRARRRVAADLRRMTTTTPTAATSPTEPEAPTRAWAMPSGDLADDETPAATAPTATTAPAPRDGTSDTSSTDDGGDRPSAGDDVSTSAEPVSDAKPAADQHKSDSPSSSPSSSDSKPKPKPKPPKSSATTHLAAPAAASRRPDHLDSDRSSKPTVRSSERNASSGYAPRSAQVPDLGYYSKRPGRAS